MPTVRFGFFHCEFCGTQFDTDVEASQHEAECPQRRYYGHAPLPTQAAGGMTLASPTTTHRDHHAQASHNHNHHHHHLYYLHQQEQQQILEQQQQQQQHYYYGYTSLRQPPHPPPQLQHPHPDSSNQQQHQSQSESSLPLSSHNYSAAVAAPAAEYPLSGRHETKSTTRDEFIGGGDDEGQSSSIAHTPLQRRRGGGGGDRSNKHHHSPSSTTRVETAYDEYNYPFFQDRDGSWKCRYCIDVPEFQRQPQSVWTSSPGVSVQPFPPEPFIHQHLNVCTSYQEQLYLSSRTAAGAAGSYMTTTVPYHHPYAMYAGAGGHSQYFPYHNVPPLHTVVGAAPYGGGSHFAPADREEQVATISPGRQPTENQRRQQHVSQLKTMMQTDRTTVHHDTSRTSGNMTTDMQPGLREHPYMHAGQNAPTSNENSETTRRSIEYLIRFDDDYWARDVNSKGAVPKLVLDEDKLLLTDYFYFLMKQLRLCRFSESDRKTRGGKREKIKIGFGGLQCIHCSDLPMSRKFFWSNVDRLANSFAEIPGHVLKCRRCPQQTKDSLLQLKRLHPDQMSKLPRGSQKVFFRRMWRRIHDEDDEFCQEQGSPGGAHGAEGFATLQPPLAISTGHGKETSPGSVKSSDASPMSGGNTIGSNDSILVIQRTASEAAKVLSFPAEQDRGPSSPSSKVLLAIPEDKEWLSEKDCYIRKQIEVFYATKEDVALAQRNRMFPISVGTIGFRCLHCSLARESKTGDHAVFYPLSVSGIYESVREFHRLHLDSCKNLPTTTREKLQGLQGASSLSSVLRKYYHLAARALGLYDSNDGIRSGGKASPIGSQAAFTFPDGELEAAEHNEVNSSAVKTESDEQERKRGRSSSFSSFTDVKQPKTTKKIE